MTIGKDEAESILHIIRLSNEKTLTTLEQARFVDELRKSFGLGVSEIATRLEVSKAWVRWVIQLQVTWISYLHPECTIKQKPRLVRELYRLSKKMTKELYVKCIKRAKKYKITRIESLAKIAGSFLNNNIQHQIDLSSSNDYENRASYQQGRTSREEDLKQYQRLIENDKHELT